MRAFRARRTDVGLLLYEVLDDKQLAAIADRHLDVGFVRSPGDQGGVRLEAIQEEPLAAVLPEEHPLAGRDRISIEALADEPWILWPRYLSAAVHDDIVAAYRNLRRVGVVFVPIDGLSSTLHLAWREDNSSPVLRAFLETAREVAAPPAGEPDS